MITSKLKVGQVLVPPQTGQYSGIRFRLNQKVHRDGWSVVVLVLDYSGPNPAWVEKSILVNDPSEGSVFHTETWLKQNCYRVCECQNHPSPDGVCELAIDDEKWVRNSGFCSWCFRKHPR